MHARWVKLGLLLAALGAVVWMPSSAAAQRRGRGPDGGWARFAPWAGPLLRAPMFGLRGGYDFNTGSGSIGADVRVPLAWHWRLLLVPSGDLFFTGGDGDDWQLNLDGELRPFPLIGLYAGAGGALIDHRFNRLEGRETKVGWNLFAGLEPTLLPVRPFVETRWTFQGDHFSAFRLAAGVDLAFLHRHHRAQRPRGGYDGRRGRRPRRDND